jgi:aldehyde:ferredoxin oxidoreductase
MMNAANGFRGKDDDLPERFFKPSGEKNGNIRIEPIDREEFLSARSNYYAARKLDQNGMPIPEIARQLGLEPLIIPKGNL